MNQESGKISSFTDLAVWQESHKLVLMIYKTSDKFPQKEIFGLTNQIRRAAVSISSNIAEGFSRQSYKEKVKFYSISLGSLMEVQNQLLIARDVGYLDLQGYHEVENQSIRVSRLCNGIIKKSKSLSLIPNS